MLDRLPSHVDDLELARRVGEGDTVAFNEIHRRHRPAVFRLCQALLGCPHDAADATQLAFVKLFKRLSLGHVPTSSKAYVLSIARHESFDIMRSRGPSTTLDGTQEVTLERDHAPELVDSLRLREVACRLPARYRKILVMRGIGLSYDEIGEELSLNRNAVAQLLFRARTRMTAELG